MSGVFVTPFLLAPHCGMSADVMELAHHVRAGYAAEIQEIQALHADANDALTHYERPTSRQSARCFTPFETHISAAAPASASASPSSSVHSTRSLCSFLLLVFRRFAGRVVVKGRLLNHEELLVTHFFRLTPSSEDDGGANADGYCVRIKDPAIRFFVPCSDAKTAQIGEDDVIAWQREASHPRFHSLGGNGVNASGSILPSFSCAGCDRYKDGKIWNNARTLEEVDELYGFNLPDAMCPSAELREAATLGDQDEGEAINTVLTSHRLSIDVGCVREMMRAFRVPLNGGFQSFAFPRLAVKQNAWDADPWSYNTLDAAQKRQWAQEKFEYGEKLLTKGRLKDAIAEFESCLKLNDKHLEALACKGRAHVQLEQFLEAMQAFEDVLNTDPVFPGVRDDLLRAKGKLEHSRHTVGDARLSRTQQTVVRRGVEPPRSTNVDETNRHRPADSDRLRSRSAASAEKSLEKDRLRQLLEEEERRKREKRRKKRSQHSGSDDDSDSSKKKHKRKRAKEKPRKSHKKSAKKGKSGMKHRRRHDSDSSSSVCSSDGSDGSGGKHHSSSAPRDHKRSVSLRRSEGGQRQQEVAAILSRPQHRLWN
ncbi:hypothetical protein BBJ28_00001510 [Nothophytophthora sp. Chile5]|nr:hypothetical protein BBJ28_00001510 [Nothophytophthora sp. Chile5]